MRKHTVVQVGLGERGETSVKSFLNLCDRVELVGVCDVNEERLSEVSDRLGIEPEKRFRNVEQMLAALKPELFSFCTLPSVRLELIKLAAEYGVKGILFEKPIATSLKEAREIFDLCKEKNIKAVVCHQHKYFEGFRRLKNMIDSGELGTIQRITAECKPWFSQLGTHYIDYAIWANGGCIPVAVAGHIHGRDLLSDTHPSPDYMLGEVVFENGVHATVQFGYMSKSYNEHKEDYEKRDFPVSFWEDDRLTVYGTTGYAWAECSGRWGAFTKNTGGKIITGRGNSFHEEIDRPSAQILFAAEFLDWIEGKKISHSCDVAPAYAGFETGMAIIQSALKAQRVDLPLNCGMQENEVELMKQLLPECRRREFSQGG